MTRPTWSEKENKRTSRRFVAWLHGVGAKCTLLILLATLVLFVMFSAASAPKRYKVTAGSISHQTITATKDVPEAHVWMWAGMVKTLVNVQWSLWEEDSPEGKLRIKIARKIDKFM